MYMMFVAFNAHETHLFQMVLDNKYKELEKGFQKKPIVAFTNSTVFILDFNI